MDIRHLTPDAPRSPHRVAPGERVRLFIGTWPIEPGQTVWVVYRAELPGEESLAGRLEATWQRNGAESSEWGVELGPFHAGARVDYTVMGRSPEGEVTGPSAGFRVAPRLYLALLWHQHQPLYRDTGHPKVRGSYLQPWVRLHALRDY